MQLRNLRLRGRAGAVCAAVAALSLILSGTAVAQLTGQVCEADIVIMLDRTGSMSNGDLSDERAAAKAVLNTFATAAVQPFVSIGAFGDNSNGGVEAFIQASLRRPYGDDDGANDGDLYRAIDVVTASRSSVGTNLRDALNVADDELEDNASTSSQVIILISDGDPTEPSSSSTAREAVYDASDAIKLAGREIFTIHFGSDPSGFAGHQLLAAIATGSTSPPSTDNHNFHGHQPGSADDKATATQENNDGDHFFIAPSASAMSTILQQIAAQYCESLPTPTATGTATHTATVTHTFTATATATLTDTATFTPTHTSTVTATASETPTETDTPIPTHTATATATPQDTFTSTPTHTPVDTATFTTTPTETITPTATATATDTITPTQTASETPTETATPTVTNTPVPTDTPPPTPTPYCGDGHVDVGESCDDGNAISGDGCDDDCSVTAGCTLVYPGTEWFVGGCGTPSVFDLQLAIDVASDGDVVTLCPGTYTEGVTVTRQVRIRAIEPGTVTVHTAGTAFDIRRSGVQIENLTIQADAGTAILADTICPLGQATCAQPGSGSHLTIAGSTILNSAVGIGWQRRIDCVQITENTLTDNDAHIRLVQLEGAPATQVSIVANQISGGGQSGAAVTLSGLVATVAANTVRNSTTAGIVLTNTGATQLLENAIDRNAGDGITVRPGGENTQIHDNNITGNGVGLGNESGAGTLDATHNWWGSQTGPSGVFSGVGDRIEDRVPDGTTSFIEFLCAPFPEGFPSIEGVCSTEVAELRQLVPGRAPDLDPFGRYIVFESTANIDVDPRSTLSNADGSQEVFLLNRRPKKSLGGVCLGGLNPCNFDDLSSCQPCSGVKDCPGDPSADPIVLNGECVVVTQLSDGTGLQISGKPRLTGGAKNVAFASTADELGDNADGSREIRMWSRKAFERGTPPLSALTGEMPPIDYDHPAPSLNAKYVFVESTADPLGTNPDGNREIFVYKPRSDEWVQITDTLPPVENRRPATVSGRRVVFDSDGDLTGENPDGNRELFIGHLKSRGVVLTQVTHTAPPVENRSGSMDSKSTMVAFSSNGDLVGQNADGNREIFTWHRRHGTFEQLTKSASGDNANPVINQGQRFVVFESTADLTNSGATNRRIFQLDRVTGRLTLLSRSRFGTNQSPRIRKRRFVVWESTANLTGKNPDNDWVVYVFDRKKD